MKLKISLKNFKKIKNIANISISNYWFRRESEGVLIICENKYLSVYASDSLMNVKFRIPEDKDSLQIIQEGKIFIDAKILINLIEHLTDDYVEIFKTESDNFQLNCGSYNCSLSSYNQPNFKFEDFDTTNYQKIDFEKSFLKEIYLRFKDFVKQNNENYTSNVNNSIIAINFKNVDKQLKILSTDAYSVVYGCFAHDSLDFEFNIIPSVINKILRLVNENEQIIEFYLNKNNLIIKKDDVCIKSRLIDETYPSIIHWFEKEYDRKIVVNKNNLIDAIDRSSLLSDSLPKIICCEIAGNKLIIENKGSQRGSSKEEIIVKNITKKNISISFDSQKLKALLRNIDSESVILALTEPTQPTIIKPLNTDCPYQEIILPTRNHHQ
ncbi:DNA polymerase III subunit beta [[Mycoplasma] cavipharyngis]|uniref:hypothetical protein n=1 Tax=[Mycoplasma] cavipharyngis TaxID=92757 RepID=UPI003703AFE2